MNNLYRTSLILLTILCLTGPAWSADLAAAQDSPVQLVVGEPLGRAHLLQPGVKRYLRYTVKDGKRSTRDIWTRELILESNGNIHIRQRWDGVAENAYTRHQESTFDGRTFEPLRHRSTVEREGQVTLSAFQFLSDSVIGDPALSGNTKLNFVQELSEPAYNFETDMELLQALPLASGYAASIPFYDPGLKPPARYIFRVEGVAAVSGPDGTAVPCWLVTTDFNRPGQLARFWVAKRTQVVIREEVALPDGGLLIKTLLPPESSDNES